MVKTFIFRIISLMTLQVDPNLTIEIWNTGSRSGSSFLAQSTGRNLSSSFSPPKCYTVVVLFCCCSCSVAGSSPNNQCKQIYQYQCRAKKRSSSNISLVKIADLTIDRNWYRVTRENKMNVLDILVTGSNSP